MHRRSNLPWPGPATPAGLKLAGTDPHSFIGMPGGFIHGLPSTRAPRARAWERLSSSTNMLTFRSATPFGESQLNGRVVQERPRRPPPPPGPPVPAPPERALPRSRGRSVLRSGRVPARPSPRMRMPPSRVPTLAGSLSMTVGDVEAAAAEGLVFEERGADAPGSQQRDAPHRIEAEYAPEHAGELIHGVAQTALPVGTQVRKVLPHLGRGGCRPAPRGRRWRRSSRPRVRNPQKPEVEGEAPHGGVGGSGL